MTTSPAAASSGSPSQVSQAAIEIQSLHHQYGERKALRGVDLQVQPGEIFGLLGPNGGGKSTLFRLISTLLPVSQGNVRVFGLDVAQQAHQVRQKLCVVFQSPSLDGKLRVGENLRHQGRLYGLRGAALESRIDQELERFGLLDRKMEQVEKLSGGQRRRVEICKALLHSPQLLLLDEPTTGLDPGVRREIWEYLLGLCEERGLTVLLSTHLLDEAERCSRVGILHQGEIVALGKPEELRSQIGGDILYLKSEDLSELSKELQERYQLEAREEDDALRVEHPEGSQLLSQILKDIPEQLTSASFGKPTLEDVFVHHTGLSLQEGEKLLP